MLNSDQKKCILRIDGPSLILAGAGSGKTRVLVYKVKHTIEKGGVSPGSIVMITFTNKAAGEMKKRIEEFGHGRIGFAGTFHSFCAFLLRQKAQVLHLSPFFTIMDDDDSENLLKHIIKEKEYVHISVSYAKHAISALKNQLISPENSTQAFPGRMGEQVRAIYEQYNAHLQKSESLDFDDLLVKGVELLRHEGIRKELSKRYTHIYVDEFQDTNNAQYTLVQLLAGQNNNITAVGDFSQSIYSWRGADIENLKRFEHDFPDVEVFHLEVNYRSTKHILAFANNIIQKNESHPVLDLRTDKEEGNEVVIQELSDEQHEADYIARNIQSLVAEHSMPYDEIAVLYRMNAQSRAIEEALLQYDIPYLLIGGVRFYERKEIKDILSYLRLLLHSDNSIARERAQKLGKRRWNAFHTAYARLHDEVVHLSSEQIIENVLAVTDYLSLFDEKDPEDANRLENIRELQNVASVHPQLHLFLEQIALVESEYSEREKKYKKTGGVRLMTLHQAKGLEFGAVFISGVEEGILPHSRSQYDKMEMEEERRLLYVGITRAKEKLYITHCRSRYLFGKRIPSAVSPFIAPELSEW